jgi:hypothetical protein
MSPGKSTGFTPYLTGFNSPAKVFSAAPFIGIFNPFFNLIVLDIVNMEMSSVNKLTLVANV